MVHAVRCWLHERAVEGRTAKPRSKRSVPQKDEVSARSKTHETGRSAALLAISDSFKSSLALKIPSLLPARTT